MKSYIKPSRTSKQLAKSIKIHQKPSGIKAKRPFRLRLSHFGLAEVHAYEVGAKLWAGAWPQAAALLLTANRRGPFREASQALFLGVSWLFAGFSMLFSLFFTVFRCFLMVFHGFSWLFLTSRSSRAWQAFSEKDYAKGLELLPTEQRCKGMRKLAMNLPLGHIDLQKHVLTPLKMIEHD